MKHSLFLFRYSTFTCAPGALRGLGGPPKRGGRRLIDLSTNDGVYTDRQRRTGPRKRHGLLKIQRAKLRTTRPLTPNSGKNEGGNRPSFRLQSGGDDSRDALITRTHLTPGCVCFCFSKNQLFASQRRCRRPARCAKAKKRVAAKKLFPSTWSEKQPTDL